MEIIYKTFDYAPYFDRILFLYRQEGWNAYLKDDAMLRRAFEKSLYLLGAFDGEELVGFIRCVGDGEHILLIQDLLIEKDHRRQKIGTGLFQQTWETFAHVRMFHVVTDLEDIADNGFYQSFGMKKLEEGHMVSYFR